MTREEIERMEAGREMDALIAEKVMGWTRKYVTENGTQIWDSPNESAYLENAIPHFSTDIAAAWQVVEKFPKFFSVCRVEGHENGDKWLAEYFTESDNMDCVTAQTVPLAICRAALQAVMDVL